MGFLVLLFPSSKQRAIKRNTELGLTGNSGVKEKLSSHVQINLLKPARNRPSQKSSAELCFAAREILKSAAYYGTSFLDCQKRVTNRSDQMLPSRGEPQKVRRVQRETAQRLNTAHTSTPPTGHTRFIFFFSFINFYHFGRDYA